MYTVARTKRETIQARMSLPDLAPGEYYVKGYTVSKQRSTRPTPGSVNPGTWRESERFSLPDAESQFIWCG